MINTLAQIIGFCGTGVTFIAYQQNKRRNILLCTVLSCSLFCVHYILLGAYTGAVMNLIGVLRSTVFVNNDKKWAKSTFWLFLFVALNIVAGIVTWNHWFSVLPLIGMVLSTVSNWMKSEKLIRFITFPSSPCWLVYNALSGSVAGVITECFIMTSLIIAIIRYDILKKDSKKSNPNEDNKNENSECI